MDDKKKYEAYIIGDSNNKSILSKPSVFTTYENCLDPLIEEISNAFKNLDENQTKAYIYLYDNIENIIIIKKIEDFLKTNDKNYDAFIKLNYRDLFTKHQINLVYNDSKMLDKYINNIVDKNNFISDILQSLKSKHTEFINKMSKRTYMSLLPEYFELTYKYYKKEPIKCKEYFGRFLEYIYNQ